MINLLSCFWRRDHPIRLNSEFHLDLQWWDKFLSSWPGVSFWLFPGIAASSDVGVTSDAAGSLGFGAYFRSEWFSGAWAPYQAGCSIAYKKLFPIVMAAFIWGPQWSCQHILFRSDNEAVMHILVTRTSRTVDRMFLLCKLLLAAARFNFMFMAQHIPGTHNTIADALSRWQEFRHPAPEAQPDPVTVPIPGTHNTIADALSRWQEFRHLAPEAQPDPVTVPVQLWQDLISPLLRQSASSCEGRAWLPLLVVLIRLVKRVLLTSAQLKTGAGWLALSS